MSKANASPEADRSTVSARAADGISTRYLIEGGSLCRGGHAPALRLPRSVEDKKWASAHVCNTCVHRLH